MIGGATTSRAHTAVKLSAQTDSNSQMMLCNGAVAY
jgi:cobalamin-dependent methionine synthase I